MPEFTELSFLSHEIEMVECDLQQSTRLANAGVNSSVQHYYRGMRDYAESMLETLRKRRDYLLQNRNLPVKEEVG